MTRKEDFNKVIKAFGLVFGDIGTSPIYTVTVIFLILKPTLENIMGVSSLIFWTLIILISIKYAWLALNLGKRGEGGTIVLREILMPLLKSGRGVMFVTILTFIGISLLFGDGVITPAISILSAVEGIKQIPAFADINQAIVMIIAGIIAIILFSFQKNGAEKVSGFFGPIMAVWFIALTLSGLVSIFYFPEILKAVNPYYAVNFMFTHGLIGFFILSEVILCATGGEALYADMGHIGRMPIIRGWSIVFFALIFNYLGQGAFLYLHPETKNILFEMIYNQTAILYIPFLILSIMATIIASQAMISCLFSIVYQGITTRIMPMFKVDYTSMELRTQIYIDSVNWFLLFFVLVAIFVFKESSNIAAAYGLAATGTMSITGIMMSMIFYLRKSWFKLGVVLFITCIDLIFLASNMLKIPHGGYWSIIIASIPLITILIYTNGQRTLYKALKPVSLDKFLEKYNVMYQEAYRIRGTALFFVKDPGIIPPYIVNTMFCNNIIYQDNILVSIKLLEEPFGVTGAFKDNITEGLRSFEIKMGYMEVINIEKIINSAGIEEKVIFYGFEDIVTDNLIWKIFSFIKKVTPSYVQFYSLPSNKLHGVITRVEL
ncbi:MAG TPA: KUP/HAK/KT family potassium transporter [Candidatus Gastranaerophilales bacterium]|nr:KUP/HAK/KT family potassium transporter [Candidatus Gastranaerophilales bacterium]